MDYIYEIAHEGEVFSFQSFTRASMMQQLRGWYASKQVPWPGDSEIDARLENFICQFTPPGFCIGPGPKVPRLSVSKIRDTTRLIVARLIKGEKVLVEPEEATRRAKICGNCPKNLHGICTSCMSSEFQDVMRHLLTRNRETKYDSILDTCSVCGCLLKAKVHISIDELAKTQKHTYPENCWMHGTACHVDEDGTNKDEVTSERA